MKITRVVLPYLIMLVMLVILPIFTIKIISWATTKSIHEPCWDMVPDCTTCQTNIQPPLRDIAFSNRQIDLALQAEGNKNKIIFWCERCQNTFVVEAKTR